MEESGYVDHTEPDISVVVCVYNEEENVQPLMKRIDEALHGWHYEVVFVDDGSTDATLRRLRQFRSPNLRIIQLKRNYGQSAALAAGIEAAKGKYIATMDGDGQNDPADIPLMVSVARDEGIDLVAGIRQKRQDGWLLRKLPSKIANRLIRRVSGVNHPDFGCTLKVFERDLAKSLGIYGEMHRFIPILANLEGASIRSVPVRHHARMAGKSKYGINRTLRVMSDLLLVWFLRHYHTRPMQLFGGWGILSLLLGGGIESFLLVQKLAGIAIGGKPLVIAGAILILAGLQLISLGLLAEMQLRTYYESQNRKPYAVRKEYAPAAELV